MCQFSSFENKSCDFQKVAFGEKILIARVDDVILEAEDFVQYQTRDIITLWTFYLQWNLTSESQQN